MIEKRYYNAKSMRAALDSFEERFEMGSEEFYAAHLADDDRLTPIMGRWLRHSWASFYREWQRHSGGDFVADVRRELELA